MGTVVKVPGRWRRRGGGGKGARAVAIWATVAATAVEQAFLGDGSGGPRVRTAAAGRRWQRWGGGGNGGKNQQVKGQWRNGRGGSAGLIGIDGSGVGATAAIASKQR